MTGEGQQDGAKGEKGQNDKSLTLQRVHLVDDHAELLFEDFGFDHGDEYAG
jgi:hypothetical protein